MRRGAITCAAVAGAIGWIASLLSAILYIAPLGWAGAAELPAMALWTLAFTGPVALTATLIPACIRRCGLACTYLAAVCIGTGLGLGSFAVAVALRGGWAAAFPIFVCWSFAGVMGFLAAVVTTRPKSWPAAASLSAAAFAALLWANSTLSGLG